ncbi:MAG: sulfur oxidation c-type cytochrome SoxX [Rhodospirillales bacterium]
MSKKNSTPFVAALAGCAVLALAAVSAVPVSAGTVEVAAMTEMKEPLTDKAGDAAAGKKIFSNRKQGNCLACHALSKMPEQPFHGQIAPPLDGVADRYSIAEIRLQVVNPKAINPDTIMPAFYRKDGLHRVLKKFDGKTILSAQQVEDLLAYLATLKE